MTDQPKNLTVGLIVHGVSSLSWHDDLADALVGIPGVRCVLIQGPVSPAGDWLWRRIASASVALQSRFRSGSSRDAASIERPIIPFDPNVKFDILVDLTGLAPSCWEKPSRRGIWRLVDDRGQALAAPFPSITTLTCGAGGHVSLTQHEDDRSTLLWYARVSLGSRYVCSFGQLYRIGAQLIRQAIIDHMNNVITDTPYVPEPVDPVSTGAALYKLMRGNFGALAERIHRMLFAESWMIGVIEGPIERVLSTDLAPEIRWLGKRAAGRYLADPFGVPGSSDRLYCEVLDQRTNTGVIKEMTLLGDAIVAESSVDFPAHGHLSYPYLFLDDGVLYCVPEASASRRCDLYVWEEGGWRVVATLLENTAAADPSIFRWENRYWLAYTDADDSAFDNLCLSYADLLEGPWHAHANNPVKIDHRSARPAGNPFMCGGDLYRPAQDCSKTYGGAVTINRVMVCSTTSFKEEMVRELHPISTGMNPHGLHTFSQWGDRVLVDGKRHVINPIVLMRKFASRMTQFTTKISGNSK